MKLVPGYTQYFVSPWTGKLAVTSQLPPLLDDYVWEGNSNNQPYPSPVLIDMRLFSSQLKNQVDIIAATYMKAQLSYGKVWIGDIEDKPVESTFTPISSLLTFILKTADESAPNAQALDSLDDGVMINTDGVISTSDSYVDSPGTATSGHIAIYVDNNTIEDSGTSIPDLESLVAEAEDAAHNALIYSGIAEAARESAVAAAEAAQGSADAAELSAGAALAEAAAAATYSSSAAASASHADDYADNAYASQNAAAASATAAAGSASSASSSASSASASATSASKSEAECAAILNELFSTGVTLQGDVSGFGPLNYPIVTTLNLTLDEIKLPLSNVNMNLRKIINVANGSSANDAVNYSQLTGISGTYLQVANNLSDVSSASESRANLGLTNVAIQSVTQYCVLLGGASNSITSLSPSSSAGQILQSGGPSANPSFSLAVYPSTIAINQILYADTTNHISGVTAAADSVLTTTSTGVPTLVTILPLSKGGTNVSSVTTSPTATAFCGWDANKNLSSNNFLSSYTTTATSAGTTTLTVGSTYQQYFTGSTTHSVVLPVTSTLTLGHSFYIVNNSTGVVTVKSSGSNTVQAMAAGTSLLVTCILTSGTTASSWATSYNQISFPLSLANGGTNASLTASNGGIVYSTSSSLAILSGTASANQLMVSGASSAPSWTSRFIENSSNGNLYIGTSSGNSSGLGSLNVSLGQSSLVSATSSTSGCTAIGNSCLQTNTGNYNTGIGAGCLISNTTSNQNTGLGYFCLFNLDSGSSNVGVGYQAGNIYHNYTQCTFLGASSDASANNLTNATAVGYGAIVGASNCLVLGNGANVGIGTSTPNAPLQFGNTLANRKIVLYEGANNDHQFAGFGISSSGGVGGIVRFQTGSVNDNYVFYAATSSSASNELMRLTGGGFLGIGTSTPHALLQFSNGLTNRKIVLYEAANNNHQFNGFGQTSGELRFQVNINTDDFVFYSAINDSSSTEIMRIKGNGKVGIGTTPDQLLTVNSSTPNKITSGSWSAISDARMKDVVGDYEHGLAEIIKIKTRKFRYNDKSGYPDHEKSKVHVGVIAQEIENILPECIVDKIKKGDISDVRVYDGTAITYALVNAVKELNKRIEQLEKAA